MMIELCLLGVKDVRCGGLFEPNLNYHFLTHFPGSFELNICYSRTSPLSSQRGMTCSSVGIISKHNSPGHPVKFWFCHSSARFDVVLFLKNRLGCSSAGLALLSANSGDLSAGFAQKEQEKTKPLWAPVAESSSIAIEGAVESRPLSHFLSRLFYVKYFRHYSTTIARLSFLDGLERGN